MKRLFALGTACLSLALVAACSSDEGDNAGSGGAAGAAGAAGASNCDAGSPCGNECGPQDAPCHQCGALHYDAECNCRPDVGSCPIWPDCSAAGPAQVGEYCGEYWWCDRPCASGLSCEPAPVDPDAGSGSFIYLKACKQL